MTETTRPASSSPDHVGAARGRNAAPNLARHTGTSRKNSNTRLPVLADYGLVDTVGPAEHSGRDELTELGEAALVRRDRYGEIVTSRIDFPAVGYPGSGRVRSRRSHSAIGTHSWSARTTPPFERVTPCTRVERVRSLPAFTTATER